MCVLSFYYIHISSNFITFFLNNILLLTFFVSLDIFFLLFLLEVMFWLSVYGFYMPHLCMLIVGYFVPIDQLNVSNIPCIYNVCFTRLSDSSFSLILVYAEILRSMACFIGFGVLLGYHIFNLISSVFLCCVTLWECVYYQSFVFFFL